VQQELAREITEIMEHKIRNLWTITFTGYSLSLSFLDIETAANDNGIYHTEYLANMRVQTEPPQQKQNNIPQCKMAGVLLYQGVLGTQTQMREMRQIT
jgi:hypothetical protein